MLWAVHPLNTQAVSYIIQRLESIMALFYLLTLYCFVRAQHSRWRFGWYLLSMLACGLGMGCKEVMVTAPLVVLCYDRAYVGRSWWRAVRDRGLFYVALAATWLVLAWAMGHFQGEYRSGALLSVEGLSPWTYLTNQAAVITHYLQLAFVPAHQCAVYGWPVETSTGKLWPYLALIGGLLIAALWLMVARPALGFPAISFFLVLAPTSSVVPIIDLAFEHRLYLPLTAIVTLVCVGLGRMLGLLDWSSAQPPTKTRQALAVALGLSATVALAMTTYARNEVYRSEESFWRDVTEKAPGNVQGWLGLGGVSAKQHAMEEAERCFLRALELAPDQAKPQATYAGLLISSGRYSEAAELLDKAGKSEPNLVEFVVNQGLLLSLQGKFAEAQPYLEAGVRAAADDEELQTNLIVNLCYLGKVEQALSTAEANLARRPRSARATNDVAACQLAGGDARTSIETARRAIELDPQLARAHATLGMAVSLHSPREAIAHLQRACDLDPQSHEFLSALANLTMNEDPQSAVELYRRAAGLRPDDVQTKLRLAMAYDATGQVEPAIALLEEVLRTHPELAPVKNYLRSLRGR